ncbi:hypothetical protein OPV22_000226 [Ensete ventricosum]|uniref:SKP1-like protein n=1 Tax=Ensete ventricosum TaxID=4639 RepID=A0AAV8RSN4_ENSVE|nr:hypothetical protein OPV22_000226 [Ensete ventricosum]RWW04360.1 hypothetical protein GW17_00032421 [Ensete ventricosum]RZS15308.1 hypothetical protein BHM03_00047120 [Ensete ventricosum]
MSSKGKEVMITEGEEEEVMITEEAEGSSSSMTGKTVTLVSSDEVNFEVDLAIANQSDMIKNMILDMKNNDNDEFVIPLLNVNSVVLAKVIQYWKQHAEVKDTAQLAAFDESFTNMHKTQLFETVLAANFLNSKPLLELLCKSIADKMKEMSVEEVREYFNIENDFTEEEEQKIRAENQWAFDQ